MPNLVKIVEGLEDKRWKVLKRREKGPWNGQQRQRPRNCKEEIVVAKGYRNIRLQGEQVAEFSYRPTKCQRSIG